MSMRALKKKDLLNLLAVAEKQTNENSSWISDQACSCHAGGESVLGVQDARRVIAKFKKTLGVRENGF